MQLLGKPSSGKCSEWKIYYSLKKNKIIYILRLIFLPLLLCLITSLHLSLFSLSPFYILANIRTLKGLLISGVLCETCYRTDSVPHLQKRRIASPHTSSTTEVFLTLQTPHATVHSSEVADAWLAWHSMPVEIKMEQIHTAVEDVHAHVLTGRFLHNSKCRQGRRSSFVVFNTPESIKSYGLKCTVFPKVSYQNILNPDFLLPLLFQYSKVPEGKNT